MSDLDKYPEGTTHTRDGDAYKVADSLVYYFEYEWKLCDEAQDVSGWLEELTPVT